MKNISCLLIVLAALLSLPSQARAADIAFVAFAKAGTASGTLTLTISKPTGTVQNHVMIASIGVRPNTATITAPSGWTLVRRINNTTASANSLAVYYKVAGGSEPASYAWTFSTSTGVAGGIQTFSGVDTTTPIDVENGQATASASSHATPSVTTTVARTMVVASHTFATTGSWAPPPGMAEGFDVASGDADPGGQTTEGSYVLQTAAGATGTKSASTTGTADTGNTHILVLRPPNSIAFVAAASAGATSGTLTLTINKPTGTLQNHVMIASIGIRPNTATITPPSGWTLVRRIDNSNATANSLAVYYKVAGASEGASYAWTFNTSTGSAGGIQTFSGVDTTTPINVENGQATASGPSHSTPSVTTTVARTMIVASLTFSTTGSWGLPSGMAAEGFDVASGDVDPAGQTTQGSYGLQTSVGATGTKSATTTGTADVGNTHILALAASRQWNYATAAATLSPPALDPWSDLVLSGSNDNKLHGMYDADGAAAFSPFTGATGPIQGRPAVLPAVYSTTTVNIAYVASQDGNVYAINTSTGLQVWKTSSALGNTLQGGPAVWIQAAQPLTFTGSVTADVVIVGTSNTGASSTTNNKVYALNGNTGATVWTFAPGNMDIISSTPYVDYGNSTVWVTSRSKLGTQASVWKLNAVNGVLITSWNNTALGESDTSATAGIDASPSPSATGSFIYVGTNGVVGSSAGRLKAIRVSDGTVFTHTPSSGTGSVKGMPWSLWYDAVGSGGETIIFTLNTTVHSVNFNGSTFTVNWTPPKTLTGTPTLSAPLDDGANHLYIGGSTGKVFQIDANTGNNEKSVPTTAISGTMGDPTYNFDQSRIHVGGTDGHIYTFTTPF
jgi:outer membrane protein assembly factor BamB